MRWLLLGYIVLFVHRPFEIWTFLGDLHLERVYMWLTAPLMLLGARRWINNVQHLAYVCFAGAMMLAWLLSPYPAAGELTVENYLKLLVFYFLLVVVIQTEDDLKFVVTGFLAAMGLYMLHSMREYLAGRHVYRMGIARMVGVDSTLGDPNSFGASVIYALPLVLCLWFATTNKTAKLLLAGFTLLSVTCVGLTGSRSSFLGLVLLVGVLTLASKYRFRALVAVVPLSLVFWVLLPESLQLRFETILYPEVGPLNAQVSAESRWDAFTYGAQLWNRNPLTGCGPGAWRPSTGALVESHNVYGQVMGEMGTLGILSFAMILGCYLVNYLAILRHYRDRPGEPRDFLYWLGHAVMLGVVLMLVLGFFGHNLFRYNWVWYGGFLVIARSCLERRALGAVAAPTPPVTDPGRVPFPVLTPGRLRRVPPRGRPAWAARQPHTPG